MKIYFEKIINEERGRKFRVHCRWHAPENKLDISLPSEEQIQEPEDFRKSKNWSRKLKKSKIEEIEVFKKSKFEEVEDLKFWRLNPSLQLEFSLGGYWRGYAHWVPTD
jgi:hypothetical protein